MQSSLIQVHPVQSSPICNLSWSIEVEYSGQWAIFALILLSSCAEPICRNNGVSYQGCWPEQCKFCRYTRLLSQHFYSFYCIQNVPVTLFPLTAEYKLFNNLRVSIEILEIRFLISETIMASRKKYVWTCILSSFMKDTVGWPWYCLSNMAWQIEVKYLGQRAISPTKSCYLVIA